MDTLKLILKRNWFEMIKSGDKKEEYREITPYYLNRLLVQVDGKKINEEYVSNPILLDQLKKDLASNNPKKFKCKFDAVTFYLGYAPNRPSMTKKIESITINTGSSNWGAVPNKEYFVIKLQ